MIRVTVDTNVLDEEKIERIRAAVQGLEVVLATTTVSLRENPRPRVAFPAAVVTDTGVYGESRYGQAVYGGAVVPETMVLDESPLGMAVLGSGESQSRFETILGIIGGGSFPRLGQRVEFTRGERRQLRDAMILEAHAREGRDVLVSDDRRGFIDAGRRQKLEALCRTKIMTVDEFCAYASTLRESR